jgi:hypothetical protein
LLKDRFGSASSLRSSSGLHVNLEAAAWHI